MEKIRKIVLRASNGNVTVFSINTINTIVTNEDPWHFLWGSSP